MLRGQHNGSIRSHSRFYSPEPLLFLSSTSSVVLMRLSGLRFRPSAAGKNKDVEERNNIIQSVTGKGHSNAWPGTASNIYNSVRISQETHSQEL
jgi:hypothetical protein